MPAAGVAHHLDDRLKVLVVEFRQQARRRVGAAHQRAGRRRVQAGFLPLVETGGVERLEIRTFPALHVDDLDEFARLDLIGLGRRGGDAPVDARVGQRLGRRMLVGRDRIGAGNEDLDRRRRILPVDAHRAAGRGDKADQRPFGGEARLVARARLAAENVDRARRGDVEPAPLQACRERPGFSPPAPRIALRPAASRSRRRPALRYRASRRARRRRFRRAGALPGRAAWRYRPAPAKTRPPRRRARHSARPRSPASARREAGRRPAVEGRCDSGGFPVWTVMPTPTVSCVPGPRR